MKKCIILSFLLAAGLLYNAVQAQSHGDIRVFANLTAGTSAAFDTDNG